MRTKRQLNNLADRIRERLMGDTTGLEDWLEEGNRVNGLTGRTDRSVVAEWNDLEEQAGGLP